MKYNKLFVLISIFVLFLIGAKVYGYGITSQINVCIKKTGLIYVIGNDFKASDCKNTDLFLSWNKEGNPGPKGDKGDVGPKGPKGDKGEIGPMGPSNWDENRIISLEEKVNKLETRCKNRFVDNNDGTVSDNCNNLTWQKVPPDMHASWDEAQLYCNNLILAGKSDWRLPSANELVSIVDYGFSKPASNASFSFQPDSYGIWSNTISKNNDGMLLVDYRFGSVGGHHSGTGALVRCVL